MWQSSNIWGRKHIRTVKKGTETQFEAGKEVSLDVSTEKSKCMLVSRQQNYSLLTANK
jgi:hypothetical protein